MSRKSRHIDVDVICPYYHWSDPNRICCEGTSNNNTTNVIFGNPTHTIEYMTAYCCSMNGYGKCKVCAMLNRKNGVKDEV